MANKKLSANSGNLVLGGVVEFESTPALSGGGEVVDTVNAQSIGGDKTFSNNVIITGDLTVNGTTTTLNTATLDVEDHNITVNAGGNDTSAQGAGLTVDRTGTSGSLIYDSTLDSRFKAGDLGSESKVLTASSSVSTDAAHRGGYGLVPVGAIVAYNPGYYTNSNNGSFTRVGPGSNDAAGVNAFLNAKGWYVCNGAAVNNANSPIWNAVGRNLPNLSDNRFLMGSSSAGGAGGSNANRDISHTHSVTSNVTAAAITLTTANLPVHSHGKGTLASAVSLTGTTTFATAGHTHTLARNTGGGALLVQNVSAWNGSGDPNRTVQTDNNPSGTVRDVTTGASDSATVEISNGAITGSTANAGSGTSFTPSLTNNAVTSGGMSANSSISILPQYLSTFYIVRVF